MTLAAVANLKYRRLNHCPQEEIYRGVKMDENRIMKFDPRLLDAIQKAMGNLPAIPGDLAKIKSLTFYDDPRGTRQPSMQAGPSGSLPAGRNDNATGARLNGWMEVAPGEFSVLSKMPNLHTLLFRNRKLLKVGDFEFLPQCRKLKKLDLSGTDFSDCRLLAELPALQYALLPDRRQLTSTQVLDEIKALAEPEPEKGERSRAEIYLDNNTVDEKKLRAIETWKTGKSADPRLIYWIAASLGKMPDNPAELAKVRLLDCRKRNLSLNLSAKDTPINGISMDKLSTNSKSAENKLPPWLKVKEGDFSLIGELPNLQALFLWGVSLENFSFLPECKGLRYINLWDTNFTDCSLLVHLPLLRYICLPPHEQQLVNYQVLDDWRISREKDNAANIGKSWREQDILTITWETSFLTPKTAKKDTPDLTLQTSANKTLPLASQNNIGNPIYRKEDFEGLTTVRGEDVVISWDGSSKIRHVAAEFYDSAPPLWKAFSQSEEEEDNWAKLSPWKAKKLTRELLKAITKGNVKTLYLSLEPWGEEHIFTLEFAGGWVDIVYMDDETPAYYQSYNPAYPDPAELSPVEFDGQLPIPKMLAWEDLELAAEIARHILKTGQLLPGTLWMADGI